MAKFKDLTNEDIEKVIDLYCNSNLSLKSIAKSIGYNSVDIIYKILRENKITKRGSIIRKHSIDEDYFEKIDTSNKAYILGFIYADGYIRKDNLALSVVVHNKDIDILIKIKNELKSDVNIEHIKNKNHNRINICSRKICNSLAKLGCRNGKTFKLEFPNLEEFLIPHFVRGFMDGDGCISVSNKKYGKYISLSFVGTESMINSLKKILKVDNRITFYRNTYALHIGKEVDVIRILDWIYKDANIFLDRKHRKYIEFKKYKNTRM